MAVQLKFTDEHSVGTWIIPSCIGIQAQTHAGMLNDFVMIDWKPSFNRDIIMQPNTVVHCTTPQEEEELLLWADQQRIKHSDTAKYISSYGNKVCHNLYKAKYSPVTYYKSNKFTILSMDEARTGRQIAKEQTMAEFSIGDRVDVDPEAHMGNVLGRLTNLEVRDTLDSDDDYQIWNDDKSDWAYINRSDITSHKAVEEATPELFVPGTKVDFNGTTYWYHSAGGHSGNHWLSATKQLKSKGDLSVSKRHLHLLTAQTGTTETSEPTTPKENTMDNRKHRISRSNHSRYHSSKH